MASRVKWRSLQSRPAKRKVAARAQRARRKFRRFFPGGFTDPTYLDWERDYKWETHQRWEDVLDRRTFQRLLGELH